VIILQARSDVLIKELPRPIKKKNFLYNYWKYKYLFLLFIPAILYYAIFCYGPMYGIQIAFKEYFFAKGIWGSKWIGLDNFRDVFMMTGFWAALKNTLIISGLKFIFGFPCPIILALLLNELSSIRFKKLVQTISYLPHFLSWVILTGIFIQILAPTDGPVNILLQQLGFEQIFFMGDPKWFRTVLITTEIWHGVGWGSIIYFAALSGINPELYEAATIDGAGRLKKIIYITLPELTPVITIMLIFAIGGIINDDFDQTYNMLNDAVLNVGDVISTYTYRVGLVNMKYSFATTVGLFKNVIAFTLVVITNFIAKRINEYGIW